MEERKTAAVIIGIIALITIFFMVVLPKIKHHSKQTISYKNCSVNFYYTLSGMEEDENRAANNKLALCLCKLYISNPDTSIANRIMEIYRDHGSHYGYDSLSFKNTKNIDSVIKKRDEIFDTLILVD